MSGIARRESLSLREMKKNRLGVSPIDLEQMLMAKNLGEIPSQGIKQPSPDELGSLRIRLLVQLILLGL